MSDPKRDFHISKLLSKILRHQAAKEGLKIDSDGYVNIDSLLATNKFKSFHTTKVDIERVCSNNEKKRFEISQNGLSIRAVQGHSIATINEQELYQEVVLDNLGILPNFHSLADTNEYFIIHGTTQSNYRAILSSGFIKKMKRTHVHFTFGSEIAADEVISGFKQSSTVLIFIDLVTLLQDPSFQGKVFLSKNKVVLVGEDIPVRYIHHHEERRPEQGRARE